MNEGVKILIDRMESNPEDFEVNFGSMSRGDFQRGRFAHVGEALRERLDGEKSKWIGGLVLTEKELAALDRAYLKMKRKRFAESIMADLLKEPEKQEKESYVYQPAMTLGSNGNLGIGTVAGSSGTSGLTINNSSTNKPFFKVTTVGVPTMELGDSKLTEKDVDTLNEMIEAWRKHD